MCLADRSGAEERELLRKPIPDFSSMLLTFLDEPLIDPASCDARHMLDACLPVAERHPVRVRRLHDSTLHTLLNTDVALFIVEDSDASHIVGDSSFPQERSHLKPLRYDLYRGSYDQVGH